MKEFTDEQISDIIKETLDAVIQLIAENYCNYPLPHIMRPMDRSTKIINKIETQAMIRLIEELEGMRDG